jgi:hypothetical protein
MMTDITYKYAIEFIEKEIPKDISEELTALTICIKRSHAEFEYFCTRAKDHKGPHIACGSTVVRAVWES